MEKNHRPAFHTILIFFLVFVLVSLISYPIQTIAQTDSARHGKPMRFVIGASATYLISGTYLYNSWYKNYDQTGFHFFNDSREWLQVDKTGHFFSSYQGAALSYALLARTVANKKKAAMYGTLAAWFWVTTIEVFDGFSAKWGASIYDVAANSLGAGLFVSQQLIWKEQKIVPKYSFFPSRYAQYRPDELGTGIEMPLKDYNATTFWLSFNMASLLKSNRIPPFLNLSIGYGASGLIGGFSNPSQINNQVLPQFDRMRQFYFSPDFDLSRIKTKNKTLKIIFKILNIFKMPLPGVEFSKKGVRFELISGL